MAQHWTISYHKTIPDNKEPQQQWTRSNYNNNCNCNCNCNNNGQEATETTSITMPAQQAAMLQQQVTETASSCNSK